MYSLRPIQAHDDASIAHIIREVSHEFGLAAASGFAVADPVLDELSKVYAQVHSQY